MDIKEELPGPVLLDVQPLSCSMTLTHSLDPQDQLPASLGMTLRLARHVHVETHDGRSLKDVEWTLTFYADGSGNKLTELHDAIGLINYYEAWRSTHDDIDDTPEACHAWVNIDAPTFKLLREMALVGKLPVGFRLQLRGLRHGFAPDGSEKVWDVKAYPNALIRKIEISTQFVKSPEPESDDEEMDWSEPPPPSAELLAIRALGKSIDEVSTRLGWVVGLLGVIAAVAILR